MDPTLSDQDMRLVWLMCALDAGHDLFEALTERLGGGASDLEIDPSAWENTMAAVEWAITQGLADEYLHMPTTEEDLERVRRVHALGSSALAGEPVSPELLPLARQCCQVLHPMRSSTPRARTLGVVEACVQGSFCLYALIRGIERGDEDLGVDPSAWENTMAALVWALSEIKDGRDVHGTIRVEEQDVARVRRLHALGSAAVSGGERSPELRSLAEQYLLLWGGPNWRLAYDKVLGAECSYPLRSSD